MGTDAGCVMRDIPLAITVEGQEVRGRILYLYENDMQVEILSPFSGTKIGSHVPHFMMYEKFRYALRDDHGDFYLTERGRVCAEEHLRALYLAGPPTAQAPEPRARGVRKSRGAYPPPQEC